MSDKDRKVVVFIDSMGDDDIDKMPFVKENFTIGTHDARPVFVTPVVLGSIYTGLKPPEHGLPAVSRYKQDARLRPAAKTLPEYAAEDPTFENVAQLDYPFIVPPDVTPEGNYWHASEAMGQTSYYPREAQSVLSGFAPAGEIDKPDENQDLAFNLRVDHCTSAFGKARNLMEQWDTDLMFLGYRVTDSYCHYQYDKGYRDDLLEQVDREIEYLCDQAEVFIFGDHGARDMTEVFRINRWLIDKGYLDVTIDRDWREKAVEYGTLGAPDESMPGETLQIGMPGVTVNEENSVAVADDPFSTGVTLMDHATESEVESLIADLNAESAIEQVVWTREVYGDGPHIDECPDLYAERAPGVFVSGNLAPEMGGVELTRTGVHHPIGAFGSQGSETYPNGIDSWDLFGIIAEWAGIDTSSQSESGHDAPTTDERDVKANLRDLGYL